MQEVMQYMKIMFASLGCDKNLVDTENMLGILNDKGFEFTDDETQADVIVVNTCCFIGDAKQESINTILEMAQHKEDAVCKALIVTGCLAHRYKDEIIKEIPEVDAFARDVAYTYTKPLEKYKNPRGGMFQAGLYPVSANVPLGGQTGATPDGRLAHMPVADGVSPSAGKDVSGPTAAANSVSRLDHYIASNGTLFNQKFHPSALSGREGLEKFVGLIQSYFDQKGSHMQFNVVSRETLLDAQKHPEQYKHLVVRVAGYSALFTTLSKSLQDDIIRRTEQGF